MCPPGSRAEAEARERGLAVRGVAMRNDLDLPAVRTLRRLMRQERPQLAHLHTGRATWLGGLAARAAGVPALTTRRMDRAVARGPRTRLIHEHLTLRTVAISPGVAERLREGGVPDERVVRIPSAVDPEALRPRVGRAATRRAEGAGDEVVLLALAALVRRKGLDVLLHALARLADRELRPALWIAGDGPERGPLEKLAGELGLSQQVRFLGRRSDPAELLAACDVLVLPSRLEGLGVAALEAMAAGRAVVATRVGGLGDAVVDGRTGLLVPPEDAVALADALAKLVADPALRERLAGEGPRRVAEGFLAEQMVAAYESLYRELVAEAR